MWRMEMAHFILYGQWYMVHLQCNIIYLVIVCGRTGYSQPLLVNNPLHTNSPLLRVQLAHTCKMAGCSHFLLAAASTLYWCLEKYKHAHFSGNRLSGPKPLPCAPSPERWKPACPLKHNMEPALMHSALTAGTLQIRTKEMGTTLYYKQSNNVI